MAYRVRVWDLPTRIFHWLLVACVAGLIATGYTGGAALEWHARLGYCVLALLLFRIVWGFIGGRWTRFANFLYHPRSVLAYLRGEAHPDHLVGHNPLGAGSVYAMLVLLLAQVGTGLFADDESAFTGPLNRFVSNARGLAATWYHKEIGQRLLIILILLHLGAVLYYLVKKRQNLITPMIQGDKEVDAPAVSARDDAASRVAAAVVLALAAAVVTWLVRLGSTA